MSLNERVLFCENVFKNPPFAFNHLKINQFLDFIILSSVLALLRP